LIRHSHEGGNPERGLIVTLSKMQQKGFTLLEIIITMFILSVGFLALCTMLLTVIKANYQSKNFKAAVNLAQNKIDDLKATSYASIVNATENDLDKVEVAGNGIFDRAVSVATAANPNYKTVEVTVSWSDPHSRHVSLKTIINE